MVSFAAVGLGGLLHPTAYGTSVVFSSTLLVLLVAVLAAVGMRGASRAFWIGFAIAGWGYLWAAQADEGAFVEPPWQFQTDGPLLTSKLLNSVFDSLHPDAAKPKGGGFFSVSPELPLIGSMQGFSVSAEARAASQRAAIDYEQLTLNFMLVGHSLWALLLAYLGGRLTAHLHRTAVG